MGYSSADPRNYLALARQDDASTEAPSTRFKFVKYLGDTGMNVEQETESIYEGGDGQDQGFHYKSKLNPNGNINVYVRPDTFTYLSAYALGSGAGASTSAGGSHVYTPNATIPYLTIEQAWGGGNRIDRAMSCILTGFQIEAEAAQPWRITAPFISGGTAYYRDGAASALTAVLESGDPAMYAGGAYLIDGATSLDVRSFTYNFERQVDDDLYTTAVYRRKIIPLTRSLSLTMQVIWQDQNYYQNILYGGAGGSQVPVALATGSFHAERILAASQFVAVDVPNLRYTGVEVNRLEPDGQTVVLDVNAMAVKAGTGICQHRSVAAGVATSYLIYP
jgi:hypothetical protein